MNAVKRLELYFKMPFKNVIKKLHWEDGFSLFELSKQCGVSRDIIYKNAKKLGLKTMNRSESAKSRQKHHTHWATGLNKKNSDWAKRSSERMKRDNPIKYKRIANRRAKTMKEVFSKKLWPQEILFKEILEKNSIVFEMQKPIGPYNIDFFIPYIDLCIEIDSAAKWGKSRRSSAEKKDQFLFSRGYNVLRIDKRELSDLAYIDNILKTYNVI